MTNAEIKKVAIQFATEDTQIAIENESMAITDTKVGVITLNCHKAVFQAFNNIGEKLTGNMNRNQMISWLCNQYTVEI